MQITCPHCDLEFPISSGFADGEGKRLAALFVEFEPKLGRATLAYLRLFKPPKATLRTSRAVKLVQALWELVCAGSVCKDERSGLLRPASQALWADGIDQMLQASAALSLPLENHDHLRAVVYGLADAADAKRERAREVDARAVRQRPVGVSPAGPPEDRLQNELAWLRQQVGYGAMDEAEYERRAAEAREKFGGTA
jgi:hypothetical protein